MKKVFHLFFVSVFFGLVIVVLLTNQAQTKPIAPVKEDPGCQRNLIHCSADLSACVDDLAGCEAQPTAPVAQTGQTTCWDSAGSVIIYCTGTGQDGDIQAGVVPPDPRFSDNGDGTITDNLTHLIWLQDADCSQGGRSWDNAFADVEELNNFQMMNGHPCDNYTGTFTDWRLPNIRELASLIDYEKSADPVLPGPNPFMNFQSLSYWSSTTSTVRGDAWSINFFDGFVPTR
jgi:hypothetical protein